MWTHWIKFYDYLRLSDNENNTSVSKHYVTVHFISRLSTLSYVTCCTLLPVCSKQQHISHLKSFSWVINILFSQLRLNKFYIFHIRALLSLYKIITHNCTHVRNPKLFQPLTFWRRNYFFNFSTSCIQNVNNTGTKQVRIMKQTAF